MPVDAEDQKFLGESDNSDSETSVYISKEHFVYDRGEQEQERYMKS